MTMDRCSLPSVAMAPVRATREQAAHPPAPGAGRQSAAGCRCRPAARRAPSQLRWPPARRSRRGSTRLLLPTAQGEAARKEASLTWSLVLVCASRTRGRNRGKGTSKVARTLIVHAIRAKRVCATSIRVVAYLHTSAAELPRATLEALLARRPGRRHERGRAARSACTRRRAQVCQEPGTSLQERVTCAALCAVPSVPVVRRLQPG